MQQATALSSVVESSRRRGVANAHAAAYFWLWLLQADLWSVGTIFFELLVGKPPFNGANHMQLLHSIERSEAKLPDHVAARLSEPCKSLLMRLLQRNPVRRISFEEFFTHPFLHEDAGEHNGDHCWPLGS